jgi:hypothetical protein
MSFHTFSITETTTNSSDFGEKMRETLRKHDESPLLPVVYGYENPLLEFFASIFRDNIMKVSRTFGKFLHFSG